MSLAFSMLSLSKYIMLPLWHDTFYPKYSQQTPHSWPMRACYGVLLGIYGKQLLKFCNIVLWWAVQFLLRPNCFTWFSIEPSLLIIGISRIMLLIGNFMQLISNWIQTWQIYRPLGGSGIANNIQWTIKLEKTDITPEITEKLPWCEAYWWLSARLQ